MKTKKENSKNFRKNNDGTDLRRLPQQGNLLAGDLTLAGVDFFWLASSWQMSSVPFSLRERSAQQHSC